MTEKMCKKVCLLNQIIGEAGRGGAELCTDEAGRGEAVQSYLFTGGRWWGDFLADSRISVTDVGSSAPTPFNIFYVIGSVRLKFLH